MDSSPPQWDSRERLKLLAMRARELRYQKLASFRPYPKQMDFILLGATKSERLLMAANQVGKSHAGAFETAFHMTGLYPEWWEGLRFTMPIRAWAAGVTSETTRDILQTKLLGHGRDWGSGAIPKHLLIDEPTIGRGIAGAVDFFTVRHATGGLSWLSFKAYEQGREKFQADTLNWIWLDEEPSAEIYSECQARTTATRGSIILTFTPLLGMSDVVRSFWPVANAANRGYVMMELGDAKHIAKEHIAEIVARYPAHEREARTLGLPMLGSGRVFTTEESVLREAPPKIPDHWYRIVGLDLGGGDHPTAAVWIAHDRDDDVIHLYDAYRANEVQILIHAAAITSRGAWIPVAWPHDAWQHDRSSGEHFAALYEKHGCLMCPEHATYDEGGFGIEAGIADLEERMKTGRLKVASHLQVWFDEYRQYHREKGKVVKAHDDLMSATRYAVMMLRYSRQRTRVVYPATAGMDYDPLQPTRH